MKINLRKFPCVDDVINLRKVYFIRCKVKITSRKIRKNGKIQKSLIQIIRQNQPIIIQKQIIGITPSDRETVTIEDQVRIQIADITGAK